MSGRSPVQYPEMATKAFTPTTRPLVATNGRPFAQVATAAAPGASGAAARTPPPACETPFMSG